MKRDSSHTVELLFLPGSFLASAAISFDYESSAIAPKRSLLSKAKWSVLEKFGKRRSPGRGITNRAGVNSALDVLTRHNIKATWFAIGHCLLKDNYFKDAYRVNYKLPYARKNAFFDGLEWRSKYQTFYDESYGDCYHNPDYYLGDITRFLYYLGHDIQCHTFCHHYVSMESCAHIAMDLEDWQSAAVQGGFKSAKILSFPFQGDYHLYHKDSSLISVSSKILSDNYDKIFLSNEQLFALWQNGIQLLTRCGSKTQEKIGAGFAKYFESDLFYMSDRGFFSFDTLNGFSSFLSSLCKKGGTVDLWMHPNNLVEGDEASRIFKSQIEVLAHEQEKCMLWIAPIIDQWNRYKHIKNDISIDYENIGYDRKKIIITNHSAERLNDLAFNILKESTSIVSSTSTIIKHDKNRFSVDVLEPKQTISFEIL